LGFFNCGTPKIFDTSRDFVGNWQKKCFKKIKSSILKNQKSTKKSYFKINPSIPKLSRQTRKFKNKTPEKTPLIKPEKQL
jgi:hypothetical protein